MPYIAPKDRKKFDPLIDQLALRIIKEAQGYNYDGAFAGLLNYTCTRIALRVVRLQFGKMRYWLIAMVSGVLKNIADEFYERIAVPYEKKQIIKNGDVDLYKEYVE